jgi:signal transduction histidine kinase/CheY-like chemotaxis protein/PAS domain-containing protein
MAGDHLQHANGDVLARLLDNAEDGLICLDGSGTVLYANESAQELLGVGIELLGRSSAEFGAPALHERIVRYLEPDATCPPDIETIFVGGRTLACRAWHSNLGERVLAVTLRDETNLVGKHERVEAVLNATADGLLVFSTTDEITYLNPAAQAMLGVEAEELLNRRISIDELLGVERPELADPEIRCKDIMQCAQPDCPAYDSADVRCWLMSGTLCGGHEPKNFSEKACRCATCEVRSMLRETFDPLCDEEYEEITRERDGAQLVFKVRVNPITDTDGDYIGRVVVMRDVTTENEIAQMKNEFVSTVSHELRTPLTSIKGYVDLILDGDAGEINEIQKEFLSIVKENSDRLVQLINDMLDISRIESGRIHLKVEPQYVPDLIDGVVDTFQAVVSQTGRELRLSVPADLPLAAADADRVRQVLVNLLSNALKYSPEGGDVSVIAEETNGMVRISVADEGLGISDEDQRLLFTKFYRVDSAMTREIGGTGLGLSICKSIIELLGGEIGVDSELGKGSTFWFTLPVAPEELVRIPEISGPEEAGGRVLVVDSDAEIASLIETYLVRRGFEVYKAHTAEEALATAVRVQPKVITLDVILEGGDGFDLLQRLKEHPQTSSIPVVVLSIVCDEGRSCRFGAANYLEKPIDQSRLLDIVGDLVGSTDSPLALVVDDDRSVVGMLSETLRRRGFAVATAYDGQEALASIEHRRPDLILLDLRMPKVDGYEVIKRVKTHEDWGDIPIVIMTAHAIDTAHVDIVAQTAGQISKPLSPDSIAARVEQLLTGATMIEEVS